MCKRKREQVRAFEQKIKDMILADPFGFALNYEQLPTFILHDDRQRERVVAALSRYQKQVQADTLKCAPCGLASGHRHPRLGAFMVAQGFRHGRVSF